MKIILSVIGVVILLIAVAGVSSRHGIGVEAVDETPANPELQGIHGFISRVEYGENTAYIFGSMHAGKPDFFPLAPIVASAMERADVFAFETELREFDPRTINDWMFDETFFDVGDFHDNFFDDFDDFLASVEEHLMFSDIFSILNLMLLPDGMTLQDILSPESFYNLLVNLETFPRITYWDIMYLTPIFANTLLDELVWSLSDLDIEYSVDFHVLDFASENEKPVIALNDIMTELSLMLDVPLHLQAEIFDDFPDWVTYFDYSIRMLEYLTEAYKNQDADALRYLVFDMAQEYHADSAFVQHDHERFVHRTGLYGYEILRLLRETEEPTTFFVTIGAAHLLYGHAFGILEANGITVEELWR
ncbi:MAG: TraB/GumN family protein [Defluviitaleaceae bacterium]|nr:TraB/GumN family protein [Defluviitaleaceae bacterium]